MTPYQTFNFAVEIEGLLVGGFSAVDGLSGVVSVEDYREGGVNGSAHRLPGPASYANLVLRYGLTGSPMLWSWYAATVDGVIRRRNGTVILLGPDQVPRLWWNFRQALPVRWSGPSFDAAADEIAVESVELVHEGLSRPLIGLPL
jgi:phage tail-like protein